ncbi:MAG: hypothetical protein ACERJ1_05325 [Halodesulfovibrio sp.]|uniref:hypothetical protein n=1 Tax=Halodesulfovibrio sp. TaxID=1912772 RepID=UPI00359E929C
MSKKILLVEPKTRTSYPPLGLMKIATYHKLLGDEVHFVIGKDRHSQMQMWDYIYITSVFTYDFKSLIDTVHFYSDNLFNFERIQIGGISATLLAEDVEKATGITPHKGLLDSEDLFLRDCATRDGELSYLLDCGACIDNLPPDYSIFDEKQRAKYSKVVDNAFFFFATKGCPNKCGFCAVQTLEPKYKKYLPVTKRVDYMRKHFGDRAGLLLLDNNIAASTKYYDILDEIIDCGYGAGAKMLSLKNGRKTYKHRYVDFNQGVDLRLMDERKMKKMAQIAIKPLRLAFDDIALEERYEDKMRLAIDCGIDNLSNYMLYNFKDKPADLYRRFEVNMRILNDHPDTKIFSFPMRYSPIQETHRKYIGEHWSKREVRATQLVLNATHGIVSHKRKFFRRAFGHDQRTFEKQLFLPYDYIINRDICEYDTGLIAQWHKDFDKLASTELSEFKSIVRDGIVKEIPTTSNMKINKLLEHYEGEYASIRKINEFANRVKLVQQKDENVA